MMIDLQRRAKFFGVWAAILGFSSFIFMVALWSPMAFFVFVLVTASTLTILSFIFELGHGMLVQTGRIMEKLMEAERDGE